MEVRRLACTDPMFFARLLRGEPWLACLDSAMRHADLGRYSVVACDPFGIFRVDAGQPTWNGVPMAGSPLDALRICLADNAASTEAMLPPFQGGAIGFLSYEFGHSLEPMPITVPAVSFPQVLLPFYDVAIVIDHAADETWLFSTGGPERDTVRRRARARARADRLERRLADATQAGSTAAPQASCWHSNFDRASYAAAAQRVIDAILAGDIFQANIAQRFESHCGRDYDHLAFYERLRRTNPAPFSAFLDFGEVVVASSSPERFLKVIAGEVEARPIKGTTARAADPVADARGLAALLRSEKDRAENVMIVDLMRNDLSKVCRPHSVKVPVLCGAETYASVHHLVSVVTGGLAEGRDAIDLLGACFPAGSITGAPKRRAMQIIAEIEGVPRETYCGAVGWLGFDGSMDLNVAIRTVTFRNETARFHAGGGVTAMSDPVQEYEETLAKAERIFAAFETPSPS